jgi:hypothetical protein
MSRRNRFLGSLLLTLVAAATCDDKVFTSEACEAAGGDPIIDPRGGTCPRGRTYLGLVNVGRETGVCCRDLRVVTVEECQREGGSVIGDPGDGSTRRDGCPDNRELLGSVRFGIEGGICCK